MPNKSLIDCLPPELALLFKARSNIARLDEDELRALDLTRCAALIKEKTTKLPFELISMLFIGLVSVYNLRMTMDREVAFEAHDLVTTKTPPVEKTYIESTNHLAQDLLPNPKKQSQLPSSLKRNSVLNLGAMEVMMPLPQNAADLKDLMENVGEVSSDEDLSQVRGNHEITLHAENPFRTAQVNPASQILEPMGEMPDIFADVLAAIKDDKIQSEDDDMDDVPMGGFEDDYDVSDEGNFEEDNIFAQSTVRTPPPEEQALKRKLDPNWDPTAQPKKKRKRKKQKLNIKRKRNFRDTQTKISDQIWLEWLRNSKDLLRDPLKTHCLYHTEQMDIERRVYKQSFIFGDQKKHRLFSLLKSNLKVSKKAGAAFSRSKQINLSSSSDDNEAGGFTFADLPQFGAPSSHSNVDSSDADASNDLAQCLIEEEISKLFPNGLQEKVFAMKDRESGVEEFSQILFLRTKGMIYCEQTEAYGPIKVQRKT